MEGFTVTATSLAVALLLFGLTWFFQLKTLAEQNYMSESVDRLNAKLDAIRSEINHLHHELLNDDYVSDMGDWDPAEFSYHDLYDEDDDSEFDSMGAL